MKKQRQSKKNLMGYVERYAAYLLYEASGGAVGIQRPNKNDGSIVEMSFSDKRALLDSTTRLLHVKHRIDPKEEKSFFDMMKEDMNDEPSSEIGDRGDSSDSPAGEFPSDESNNEE